MKIFFLCFKLYLTVVLSGDVRRKGGKDEDPQLESNQTRFDTVTLFHIN